MDEKITSASFQFPPDKVCPVCGTNDSGGAELVPISGTNDDGGKTFRAEVVHLECIVRNLMLYQADIGAGTRTTIGMAFDRKDI